MLNSLKRHHVVRSDINTWEFAAVYAPYKRSPLTWKSKDVLRQRYRKVKLLIGCVDFTFTLLTASYPGSSLPILLQGRILGMRLHAPSTHTLEVKVFIKHGSLDHVFLLTEYISRSPWVKCPD